MKITAIHCTPLWAPRKKFFGRVMTTAQSAHQPAGTEVGTACLHALIRVKTDSSVPGGIIGLGEVATCWSPDGVELCSIIDDLLAPVLLGQDPFQIALLAAKMEAAVAQKYGTDAAPAKAAVEIALYDIVGKALQTPVYNLLGGRVRDVVPLSHSIPWGSPEEMASMAAEKKAAGFGTVKCKVGQGLDLDAAACRAVREAIGPAHTLRVDANMGWATVEEAAANIEALSEYNLELVEQPLPRHQYQGLAELRTQTGVPIMVDESLWDPVECAVVIKAGAADVANVYISESGGVLAASRNLAMCEAAGITGLIGAMPELGIGTAAQIHLALASTNIGHDCDTCGSLYFDEDYLVTALDFSDGVAKPPPGPIGLGVEVDMDVVKRWAHPPNTNAPRSPSRPKAPPPSRL